MSARPFIDMVHKLIESTAELQLHRRGQLRLDASTTRSDYLEKLCLKPGTLRPITPTQIKNMDEPDELVKLAGKADAERFLRRAWRRCFAEIGIDMREFERVVLLSVIDRHWMDHIDDMDNLRRRHRSARLWPAATPCRNTAMESYDMFNDMIALHPGGDACAVMYQSPNAAPAGTAEAPSIWKRRQGRSTGAENTNGQAQEGRRARQQGACPARVGRNQPCPCGSGKKYKHCCGKG